MGNKLSIKQQIIDDRINDIAEFYNLSKEEAFSKFCYSIFTNTDFDNNNYDFDDIDGSHEHQIDLINIIKDPLGSATINIFQFKYKTSFESNIVKQMKYGIEFVLNVPKKDIITNPNKSFVDKIMETRDVRKEICDINTVINIYYITIGDEKKVSDEYNDVVNNIITTYDNGIFESVNFYTIGENEIINKINSIEKIRCKVDEDMAFLFNGYFYIQYNNADIKGVLLTVNGNEIARIVNKHYSTIFDQNVRNFLGIPDNIINKDIYKSCSDIVLSRLFWFLNNGITIVCDNFKLNTDPDSPFIRLFGMQIINGCQTSMVLSQAKIDNILNDKVNLIVRVIETTNQDVINNIVRATNSQTRITSRDLRSNDLIQKEMESAFLIYKFHYQRKTNPIPSLNKDNEYTDITNELIAQSFLAVFLKRPSKARNAKALLWTDDLYNKIFDGLNIERYVIAFLLYSQANSYIRKSVKKENNRYYKDIGRYVTFHISRIAAYLINNNSDDWSSIDQQKIIIDQLRNNTIDIVKYFKKSSVIINNLIKQKGIDKVDIVNYTKSDDFDEVINTYLYKDFKQTK